RHPERWRAGVALYPVTDWAHYNQGYTSRILNGAPYEDEEAYRRSSPVYYVESYQRGLQIQHGLVDGNVQTQDTFRLVQMLMEREKPFDVMIYPMQDHGWDEEPSRRDSYWRMTRWFDQELLGRAAVTGDALTEESGG
ncbi:MAG TPA: prolyl oligopeptidase family serine peptidase, partial [Longimicrobiales bacterium]|nr:prolyl oligopeptidase family serine peptidase [Longimicrobiales bacterium]